MDFKSCKIQESSKKVTKPLEQPNNPKPGLPSQSIREVEDSLYDLTICPTIYSDIRYASYDEIFLSYIRYRTESEMG
jgi:hypothetical protein